MTQYKIDIAPEAAKEKEKEKIEEVKPAEEIVKAEAPEIEGPKVLKKIDLSTIDSSTRPKKITKKKRQNQMKKKR